MSPNPNFHRFDFSRKQTSCLLQELREEWLTIVPTLWAILQGMKCSLSNLPFNFISTPAFLLQRYLVSSRVLLSASCGPPSASSYFLAFSTLFFHMPKLWWLKKKNYVLLILWIMNFLNSFNMFQLEFRREER